MSCPKVTVLIPVYNGEQYIAQAVDSALGQSGVSMELVVIDDGSTDSTLDIVRGYGDKCRLLRRANRGPASARNTAAQIATGEWLAFLDADDQWLPTKLATQLAAADEKVALVYTDRRNVGETERVHSRQSNVQTLHEDDVFEHLLFGNFITLSSVLIRRDVFQQLGGFDENPLLIGVEDWDLWLRYAAGRPLRVCRDALTLYQWHQRGISRRIPQMHAGRLEVLRRAFSQPRATAISRSIKQEALRQAFETTAWYAAAHSRCEAFKWYARALWRCPWRRRLYRQMLSAMRAGAR